MCVCLSDCMSVNLCVCLTVYLSVSVTVYLSICLSICLTLIHILGLSSQDLSQLMSVGEAIGDMGTMAADITKGFSTDFIEREIELLSAIMDGKAIEHHLEPSYYKALCYAADNHNKDDDDDVDVDDEILEFSIEDPGSKGEE